MTYHTITAQSTAELLKTDIHGGLSDDEAARRLRENGPNVISDKPKRSLFMRILAQLSDFMIIVLLCAAAVSLAVSAAQGEVDFAEPAIILLIVILNAVLGVAQEYKAEKSLEELKRLSSPTARVRRGGRCISVPSEQVVVGDVLLLAVGDSPCADCRLITSHKLAADESSLTGESTAVKKSAAAVFDENTPLAERANSVYASTAIMQGSGEAIVTHTGMDTEVGRIAGLILSEDGEKTPLQKKLGATGKALGTAALGICALIFALGLWRGIPPGEMFITAVSLAVAAIPEGLAAIVTIMLAIGVERMVRCGAVVRRLPSVETLGGADVICTDKTGTLTKNEMTVTSLSADDEALLLTLACMCSDGQNPTDKAVIAAAKERGIDKEYIDKRYQRTDEVPFSSEQKYMRTVCRFHGGRRSVIKGAPEVVLGVCAYYVQNGRKMQLTPQKRREIAALNEEYAAQALRVIAAAYSDEGGIDCRTMTYAGMICMSDPPRDEVYEAVRTCHEAGVRIIMITGDHAKTAEAVAVKTGICTHGETAVTGAELDKMNDKQLSNALKTHNVFARTTPEHKLRIVKALKREGHVCAMTGDGANDAPALKAADIGCSMGISGTEVAKSASDMVLTDDNFATVVEAMRCGRGIYDNVTKAVRFLLSSNIGEIMTVFSGILIGQSAPLTAIQLLWINLVTDSLPAIALGLDKSDRYIMKRPPRPMAKSMFSDGAAGEILLEGALIGALALVAFSIGSIFSGAETGRTMSFCVLGMSQLVHAFNMRSERSLFSVGVFSNMYLWGALAVGVLLQMCVVMCTPLAGVFAVCALTGAQWCTVAVLSVMPLCVVELQKRLSRGK